MGANLEYLDRFVHGVANLLNNRGQSFSFQVFVGGNSHVQFRLAGAFQDVVGAGSVIIAGSLVALRRPPPVLRALSIAGQLRVAAR